MKVVAYKFHLECACKPAPIFSSSNVYESDIMAGRLGFEIWQDFYRGHEARVTLEAVAVDQNRVIPASPSEGLSDMVRERAGQTAH